MALQHRILRSLRYYLAEQFSRSPVIRHPWNVHTRCSFSSSRSFAVLISIKLVTDETKINVTNFRADPQLRHLTVWLAGCNKSETEVSINDQIWWMLMVLKIFLSSFFIITECRSVIVLWRRWHTNTLKHLRHKQMSMRH